MLPDQPSEPREGRENENHGALRQKVNRATHSVHHSPGMEPSQWRNSRLDQETSQPHVVIWLPAREHDGPCQPGDPFKTRALDNPMRKG